MIARCRWGEYKIRPYIDVRTHLMERNRDIFPIFLAASLVIHAGLFLLVATAGQSRTGRSQTTAKLFELVRVDSNLGGSGIGPGAFGEPLRGEPGPRPRGSIKGSRALASHRAEEVAAQPVLKEQTPKLVDMGHPTSPSLSPLGERVRERGRDPSTETTPAASAGAPGGTALGVPNGTGEGGEGGTGDGGSRNGCIGCEGGGGGHGSGIRNTEDWRVSYRKKVYARIQGAKQYPYSARRAGMEGRVVVRFTIGRNGELKSVSVVTPCPYPMLNSDALAWVQRACPFPAFPSEALESNMVFTYGLRYELTE